MKDLLWGSGGPFIDYSKKKILVVDDFPNMQQSLRSVLKSFGITNISTAGSAAEAIQRVKTDIFDGILCDYNLGGFEKDGQQTLEEMRSCALITLSTVFIMVTAETSYEKVVAAAEFAPDDYIIKPFNTNTLKKRLSSGFAKKSIFAWVYEQTAKGHLVNACAKCDEIILKYPEYRIDALRFKGELLLTMGKSTEAEELYAEIVKRHAIPWARFGLVRAFHMQGKDDIGEKLLLDIIEKNPEMIMSYDLLADIQASQWRDEEVQQTLQLWVNISPKSLTRQRRLGDAASKNGDAITAEKAYKKIVSEKYSYNFRPADMATLARTYLAKGDIAATRDLLAQERRFLQDSDEGKIIVSANMAEIYTRTGDVQSAKRCLEDVMHIREKGADIHPDILLDVVGTCLKTSMDSVAVSLSKELAVNNASDQNLMNRIGDVFASAGIESPIAKPVEVSISPSVEDITAEREKKVLGIGRDAANLFKNGDLDGAYAKFCEAAELAPDNQRELLNCVVIIARMLQKNGMEPKLITEWRNFLKKAGNFEQNEQYKKIGAEWKKIEVKFDTLDIVF